MNMFRAFMELDTLYESAEDTEYSRAKRDFKHCVKFDDINDAGVRDLVDKLEGSNIEYLQYEHKTDNGVTIFHEDLRTKSWYHCSDCGHFGFYFDDEVSDGCCPKCHNHHGGFVRCEENLTKNTDLTEANLFKSLGNRPKKLRPGEAGLADAKELSTDFNEISVVDQVKGAYEAGLFAKLPVGRDNALTLDIAGVDKERLTGYFKKQPEFAYELNNGSGIISHEFISDKYDVEVFDSFIQMYRIPQNESLAEDVFTLKPSNNIGFKTATGGNVNMKHSPAQAKVKTPVNTAKTGTNIVTIVYDNKAHKLRARADDGVHGEANVAFPNNLRNTEGQQYSVEDLIWNGKNYRVAGAIKPISGTNSLNITENLTKENNEMNNFASIFEELSKLYENDKVAAEAVDETASEAVEEACDKKLVEAADEDVLVVVDDSEEAPVDETEAEEAAVDVEPETVALECTKCGAICLCDVADLLIDEETDLANIEQPCNFCEETAGYTVVGAVVPYVDSAKDEDNDEANDEAAEDDTVEESAKAPKDAEDLEELLDTDVTLSLDGGQGNDVDVL